MGKPHFVLRESKGPEQIIAGGSRQHRPAVAQKRDGHDRVLGGPWCIWFSVRAPPSGSPLGPSTVGKHRAGGTGGWQDWNLSGTSRRLPRRRAGPALVLTETPGSPGSPGLP